MAELVPDTWRFQDDDQDKCCHQAKWQRRGPVTDILLWVECYSSLVGVLASKFPTKVPELMAYLKTIVHAHKSFTGEGWVTYDACYRRKAAAVRSLEWSQIDFTLYNETFAGRARAIVRCRHCNSDLHSSAHCSLAPEQTRPDPAPHGSERSRFDAKAGHQVCQLYNHRTGNRCRFSPCKFLHQCTDCRGGHPASQCRMKSGFSRSGRPGSPAGRGRK